MSVHQDRRPRNPISVYFSIFLLAILFVIIGNSHLSPEALKAISINLASDMIALIVVFFVFSRVFLIDNDKDSAEMLDEISIIKNAIIPYSKSSSDVDDRENRNWLWNSIKEDSQDKPEDEKDRIKRIAKKVDLLLSEDPEKSELYRLRQSNEYLQKQMDDQTNEYRGEKLDWEEKSKRMEDELERVREDLRQKQELINLKDKRLDEFSSQLQQLQKEVREGMSDVRRSVTSSFEDVNRGIYSSAGNINYGQINALQASNSAMISQLEKFENSVAIKLDHAVSAISINKSQSTSSAYPDIHPYPPDGQYNAFNKRKRP